LEKWRIIFSKSGKQDWKTVSTSIYKNKVMELLSLIEIDPFKEPPSYKSLQGDMKGAFSRKINDQHRLCVSSGRNEKNCECDINVESA
jgi:toxin YoeB